MKKLAIFFLLVIIIVAGMYYMYLDYQAKEKTAKRENYEFDSYYQKEIFGTELTTIINKAFDRNTNNEVQKDNKGKYIDNNTNSIKIDIKMLDNDKIYDMETLQGGSMEKFVEFYNQIQFKCVEIKYHNSTKKVKYLLFEQITQ